MLKATSSRNGGCRVEGEGSIAEQLNDLLNIIQSMNNSMLRIGKPAARMFRAVLIAHLLPPIPRSGSLPTARGTPSSSPERVVTAMAKCRDYKTHADCPYFHKCTDPDEEVQVGTSMKKLQQHCFYCFKTPGVKKIAAVPSFTGRIPKWCPLGRDEEGR